MIRAQLSVSAENTWYSTANGKIRIEGGRPFKVGIVQGSVDSTVTVREYDVDGTTLIDSQEMTESQIVETTDGAYYDFGVATGGFGTGACLITVRQG